MDAQRPTAEVREALEELQLYLSDGIPPLVAAGSVELLTRQPAEVVASAIDAWTGAQYRRGHAASVPVSDYLFHAIRKIHLMGEYRLVPRERLDRYLSDLKAAVLAYCPDEDRELLAENLNRLEESAPSALAAPVERIFRQIGGERAGAAAEPPAAAAGSVSGEIAPRRFSAFLERLGAEARGAGGEKKGAPSAETLAAAARRSETAREVDQYLSRLREMGLQIGTADVFRALAQSLPAWAPPPSSPEWPAGKSSSRAVEAMRRMVAEAEDPLEGARRFGELVRAAIERFNEGSLAQAVSALELAQGLIAEKRVDPGTVEVARRKGDETLDPDRLKRFAESPGQHAALRRVLGFFTALTPDGLLEELPREPKRDRRRLLLLLLEAHGEPARTAALAALRGLPEELGPDDWYFRRNLLYLLRRIPRAAGASPEEEIDAAARYADLKFPPALVKEAVGNLAQSKHQKSEEALKRLLAELEGALQRPDAPHDAKELLLLLDRVVSALARFGTPGASRAAVEHALRKETRLGDTMGRLAELSGQDVSEDPELVERLVALARENLPFRLLGLTLRQNDRSLLSVIEALSGTPAPAVRSLLEEIVSRFPGEESGKAAARSLAGFRRAAAGAEPAGGTASLSGDLELFGLPSLLQSLSDSSVSGALTLIGPKGEGFATLVFASGKLRSCRAGALTGDEAFYQLLERPAPGQFQFAKAPGGGEPDSSEALREILPLTLEAMRRHDELKEAAALAPDDAVLEPTEVRPTPHAGETDGLLLKSVWTLVARGATPRQCEAEVATDAYRIRRLIAHWVEQGALKVG